MSQLFTLPKQVVFSSGTVQASAKAYFYATGTTTLQNTYQDAALTTTNTNPVIADSSGTLPPIYLDPSLPKYKFTLENSAGTVLYTTDPINPYASQSDIGHALYPQTAAESAASITPTNYYSPPLTPERYGAIGDGVHVCTSALNAFVAVVNASTNPSATWPSDQIYLCGPINTITANNFTWNMFSTILVQPNSWSATTNHIVINGKYSRIYGLTINGNQSNFSSATGVGLLAYATASGAADDFLIDGASLQNSPARALTITSTSSGRIINCHFDNNAMQGVELDIVSYIKVMNTTFSANGYGFQNTFATNAHVGYGAALRYRSHHCTFVDCEFKQNGIDGMMTNQGSYALKYIGCLAWMNGDGGFTLAADQTNTGYAGEAESPYDVEYVDCESYNNWGSGIAAYVPVYNVTILGGRYYNNWRGAGTIATQSSSANGIYFGGGSLGVDVRAKCYDDRQLCLITAVSGSGPVVLSASNWGLGNAGGTVFQSTYLNYRTVVILTPSMTFGGYAFITGESSGSVTIIAASQNSVTLSSIAAGWYVTQRTQHNGCFLDNGCTGTVDIDSFGQIQGPVPAYEGFGVIAGYLNNNMNVRNIRARLNATELLLNPSWDTTWMSTTTNGTFANWAYSLGGGGAGNSYGTAGPHLHSVNCLQLIGGTSVQSYADGVQIANAANYQQGAWFEASVLCEAVNPGDAALTIYYQGTSFYSQVLHPGGGVAQLKICGYVPQANASIGFRVISFPGKTNYFDEASLRMAFDPQDRRDASYPSRNLAV